MNEVKTAIAKAVSKLLQEVYNVEVDAGSLQIDPTRKEFEGELTLVVFPLVRHMNSAPEAAGQKIGEALQNSLAFIQGFNVVKGFLNLQLTDGWFAEGWQSMLNDDGRYEAGHTDQLSLVEFSSPNTNKPLHLGHLRNIFLGHSVSLIKAQHGNKVIKTQIINDRGVHICKSMLAWQRFGDGETPESSGLKGDQLVGKYYVRYDQELKKQVAALVEKGMEEEVATKNATLTGEVQQMLLKWENNDPEVRKLWEQLNGWVYKGFDATYERMQVNFDHLYYESETFSKGKDIVLQGLNDGHFYKKDDGSVWCDLSDQGLDHKLLLRADGTTVYMTQDIGTAVQRYEDYPDLSEVIYTVGDEQDHHFKVLFKILEKLGYDWAARCQHLSYGMVDLPSGKMKSREGTVVDADNLMQEVVEAAKMSSAEKGKLDGLSQHDQDELFEVLGLGALKFFLLRVDPKKRMLFDPQESVSLQGDTGPFVQYTYARCRAVLRKAGEVDYEVSIDGGVAVSEKERALMMLLMDFSSQVKMAAESLSPAIMANYCLDLAKHYNQFYQDTPILKADGAERIQRLALTRLTAETIKAGMALLGIDVPEQM